MTFSSLEDSISNDNEVRFIDAFVDKLDLQQLGVQSLTATDKKKQLRNEAVLRSIFLVFEIFRELCNGYLC
ncbi:hypothetical protein GCM10023173_17990 [Sphingobacterium thermophilum]|uniref:Uncharacterized protein n=1 Tax=Sphingobacterium thermophilum TaxID=768534 RepID=A0ABP8R3N4_9SPHI